jgi:hypothetical protein
VVDQIFPKCYNNGIQSKKEPAMQIETAVKQIQNEADFQGMGLLETMQDIQKHGRMMYSERTMEAFVVFVQQGQELFAPVDQ